MALGNAQGQGGQLYPENNESAANGESGPPTGQADQAASMDQTSPAGSEAKIENASSSFSILTQPPAGSVANNADGTFSFDPGPDFRDLAPGESRTVSFTFLLARSEVVSATVTVTGTSDGPIATDVQYNSLGAADPELVAGESAEAVPAHSTGESEAPEPNQEPFLDSAPMPDSEAEPAPSFGTAPAQESQPAQEPLFDAAAAQEPSAVQETVFDAAPAQELEEPEFSQPAAASTPAEAAPVDSVPSAAAAWDQSPDFGGSSESEASNEASPWDDVSPTVEAVQWSDAVDSETKSASVEAVDSPDQVDAWAVWGGSDPEVTESDVVDASGDIALDGPVQDQGFPAPSEPAAFEPGQTGPQDDAAIGAPASEPGTAQTEAEFGVPSDAGPGFDDDPWGGHTASDDDPWGVHTASDTAAGWPTDSEATSEEVVAPVEPASVEPEPVEPAPVEPASSEPAPVGTSAAALDSGQAVALAPVDTEVAEGCITGQPAAGRAIDNGDGTFDFDPGADFNDLQPGETRDVTFCVRLPTGEDYQATVTVAGDPAGPFAKDVTFERLPLDVQAEPQPVDAQQDDTASAAAADFAAFGSGSGFGGSFEAEAPSFDQDSAVDLATPTAAPESPAAAAPAGDEPATSAAPEASPAVSDWPAVDAPAFSDIEQSALALEDSEDSGVEAPTSEAPTSETSASSESNDGFMTGFGGFESSETSEPPVGEPAPSEPAPGEPASGEPASGEPASGELGAGTPSFEAPVPQEPVAADNFSSDFALESDPALAAEPADGDLEVRAAEGERTAFAPPEDSGPRAEEPASPTLPEDSPAVDTPLEAGSIWQSADDKPSQPHAEGRPDTLQLGGVTAGPGAGGWDIRLTSGEILEQNPGCVILSPGAAGTLHLDDSSVQISFSGIERIVW